MKTLKIGLTIMLLFVAQFTFSQTTEKAKDNLDKNSYEKTLALTEKGVSTVYHDLKDASPKLVEGLNHLSKELKVGAISLWEILVAQQKVWSIAYLCLTISSIVCWSIFYRKNYRKVNSKTDYVTLTRDKFVDLPNPEFDQEFYDKYVNERDHYYSNKKKDPKFQKTIRTHEGTEQYVSLLPQPQPQISNFKYLHLIFAICLTCLSIYHFKDMLTGFMNPKYGALKTITQVATQLKDK